jgi:hypothetical protein
VYERVFSSCKLPVFFSPFSLSSFASFFFALFIFLIPMQYTITRHSGRARF